MQVLDGLGQAGDHGCGLGRVDRTAAANGQHTVQLIIADGLGQLQADGVRRLRLDIVEDDVGDTAGIQTGEDGVNQTCSTDTLIRDDEAAGDALVL